MFDFTHAHIVNHELYFLFCNGLHLSTSNKENNDDDDDDDDDGIKPQADE